MKEFFGLQFIKLDLKLVRNLFKIFVSSKVTSFSGNDFLTFAANFNDVRFLAASYKERKLIKLRSKR